MAPGAPVIKFGQIIGFSDKGIEPGEWVHEHNVVMHDFERDYRFAEDARNEEILPVSQQATFEGFRRAEAGRTAAAPVARFFAGLGDWTAGTEVLHLRRGEWLRTEGVQLTGKTIGLLGFGGIAEQVARIAGGSGMKVIAWNRSPKTAEGVEFVELDRLLAESHVLSVHLLLNDETRGFLNADRIARMRPGAILINTARGAVVDEAAMIAALRSGQIGHAGLDVFDIEPLPAGHELTTLENVTLSAHSAFRTPEASDTLIRRALDIACTVATG